LKIVPFTLKDFNEIAGSKTGLDLNIQHPYKICDLKPAYGEIFDQLIEGYDFWGYGDLDLVYGNIMSFFPEAELDRFDIISNHPDFITGHFCMLRNTPGIKGLYRTGNAYRTSFAAKYYTGFDEQRKNFRINPDPRFLYRDQKLDRKGHRVRYRMSKRIGKLIPARIRLPSGSIFSGGMRDFSSIVRFAEKTDQLRVSYRKIFESDLMLSKLGKMNWEITWKDGSLTNKENQELLYFHFILSKRQGAFRVMEYRPGLNEFTLTPGGIRK
jgi:hypothetical protein